MSETSSIQTKRNRKQFSIFQFPIIHSVCPPQILHKPLFLNAPGSIAFSQEHFKTISYAKFGGQTECIMGNWKIVNIVRYCIQQCVTQIKYRSSSHVFCFFCFWKRKLSGRVWMHCSLRMQKNEEINMISYIDDCRKVKGFQFQQTTY